MSKNNKIDDKVLFWIDMSWNTFAIAKHLQDKNYHNLYTIIDISEDTKDFFEKQNIVDFKKIWFYRDAIKTSQSIDINYLISIEKKYGLNIWSTIYSDKYFYKFNTYYNFSRDEILSIIQNTVMFYEKVLDESSPKFLVIRPLDDMQTELLHKICKSRGIHLLILSTTRVNYKFMISEKTDKLDNPFKNNSSNISIKSFSDLHKMLEEYPKALSKYVKNRHLEQKKIFATPYFFLKIYKNNYKKYFRNFGRTRRKIIFNELLLIYQRFRVSRFFERNTKKSLDFDEPFIYFPLHFEPERSLTEGAPYYTNQIEVITHVAKSLPIDFKLVVKEHPFQKVTGWKKLSFYKSIMVLPNVVLIHPSFSQKELLKNCSLVFTIIGTSGLEIQFYGKPSIILGDCIYSGLSSVLKVENLNDIPDLIKKALTTRVDLVELNNFVNHVEANSFEYDWMGIQNYQEENFLFGGFLSVNISDSQMQEFLKKFHSAFEIVSNEIIRKMNYFKNLNE